MLQFAKEHRGELEYLPTAFLSVTLRRIDTMLVRWFPKPAAVGKLLFHKPKRFTMEEKAYDNRSDPA
jgi:hypothetical protein